MMESNPQRPSENEFIFFENRRIERNERNQAQTLLSLSSQPCMSFTRSDVSSWHLLESSREIKRNKVFRDLFEFWVKLQ